MPKITVAGDAVVVTSAMKLEDLKTIAKYRPDALVLKGGEDGKEPIFAIATATGYGEINKYGATFCSESNDDAKLATITLNLTGSDRENIKEFIADKLGCAFSNLKKLEEILPDVLSEIKADKEAVMNNITIVQ